MISETMIKGVTDTLCCIKIASNLTDIELKHVFFFFCPSICLAEVLLMYIGLRYSPLLFLKCWFALGLVHVSLIFSLKQQTDAYLSEQKSEVFREAEAFDQKQQQQLRLETFTFHFCLFLLAEENPHGQAAHPWSKQFPLCALN